MGGKSSKCSEEDINIKQLKEIPDDISRDVVIIKNLKKLSERVEKLEKEKADKIFYKLPAINICAPSLL